jgi:isoprenylcysteine carboxyl methyltransferase (ICMT) family protein YpbQ
MSTTHELAAAEAAYRKALFTVIGHGVFFVACCAVAVIARRMFKMPPALLTVVFAVALLLFGGDLFRYFSTKRRLARLRAAQAC